MYGYAVYDIIQLDKDAWRIAKHAIKLKDEAVLQQVPPCTIVSFSIFLYSRKDRYKAVGSTGSSSIPKRRINSTEEKRTHHRYVKASNNSADVF